LQHVAACLDIMSAFVHADTGDLHEFADRALIPELMRVLRVVVAIFNQKHSSMGRLEIQQADDKQSIV
jgi:hypothetical protein